MSGPVARPRVTGHQIVTPKDLWIVKPTATATITIFACHPKHSAARGTSSGWCCCRVCDVEWMGETACFRDSSHAGDSGRLRPWCGHGLRCVAGPDGPVCPQCDHHRPSELTPEFLDAVALAADRALRAAGI